MSVLTKLQFQKPRPIGLQIADQVRGMILSGELEAGAKLPTTKDLAEMWQTDVKAVHNALVPLVKEGLLVRHPGVGTFVRQREEKLTRVGIYYLPRLSAKRSPYELSLRDQLEHLLMARGMNITHWFDPRPRDKTDTMWPELLEATRAKKVQALIIPGAGPEQLQWLKRLAVPMAGPFSSNLPYSVSNDLWEMVELGLRELKRQGCRSVGALSPMLRNEGGAHTPSDGDYRYLEALHEVTVELGLELRNEWVSQIAMPVVDEQPQMQLGYEEFRRLWALPAHPDGLLVYPDTVAKGVVAAVLEHGVRVPTDLKLVLAKNKHTDLFCPFPATFVVHDEAETAAALIEQVAKQFRGETCEPVLVGFTVSSTENAGKL